MAETEDSGVMSLTVTLLSAYFANNTVPSAELPALVEGTRKALLGDAPVATPVVTPASEEIAPKIPIAVPVTEEIVPETPAAAPEYKPKVSVDESLSSPDHILSLIDGKPYKTLKRHLAAQGLTPAEYRGRYGLPADYPIVARGYSAARREAAVKLGLGGKRNNAAAPVAEEVPAPPVAEAPEPVVVDRPPAKPAPARRPRAKAVEAEPKPAAKKPKRKVLKIAAAKAPAESADAAQKPKPTRAKKTDAEAAPSAEPAPEAVLAAG